MATGSTAGSCWLLALATGGLAGLALPPLGSQPLLLLALAGLWQLAGRPGHGRHGALWGFAAVLVSHRWLIGLHPLDWIGVPGPLSLPLCLLLLILCGGFGGLLVGLWLSLAGWLGSKSLHSVLALSGCWGLAEVALAKGPLFWMGLGAAAPPGDPSLAGLGAAVGAGGLAAIQLLLGWGLWRCLLEVQARSLPRLLVATLLFSLVLLALQNLGGRLLGHPAFAMTEERVLVLQPAIPTREKFSWNQQQRLQELLSAALSEAARRDAALLLLPEGALGLNPLLDTPAPVELISGGFRWQRRGDQLEQRSSLLRFPAGATQAHGALDKHRLVPLGEWIPLQGLIRWGGLSAVGGLEPGPASRRLIRPKGPIAAAICYELADGDALATATRNGAGWLLASANLDPYPPQLQAQFQALAQLRAIETGRWLVSVANTGPSLLVNPRGEVQARLVGERAATGLFQVPDLHRLTAYCRFGNVPLIVATLLAAALSLGLRDAPVVRGKD